MNRSSIQILSNQNLAGYATFSFDYFLNGGIISCACPDCGSEVKLPLKIYHSGKLVEELTGVYSQQLIDELVEKRIVNIEDSNLHKYILWNMDARYEIIPCKGCSNAFLSIFGMAELQPGREEVQFKGIWKLNA